MQQEDCDPNANVDCVSRADGRRDFPSYLLKVRLPAGSKRQWDVYRVVATSPPSEVLHPLLDKCRFPVNA